MGVERSNSEPASPTTGVAHVVVTFGHGGAERVAAGLFLRARARGERTMLIAPRGGVAHEELEREIGAPVYGASVSKPDEPNRRDALRFGFDALVRTRRARVVHAHLPWSDRIGTALLARGRRPAVLTFQLLPERFDPDEPDLLLGARVRVARAIAASLRLAPLVLVALTAFDRERLERAFPGVPVEVVPNVPLPPAGIARGPLPFGSGLRLLAVGRLNPQKGFDMLLRALAASPMRERPWSLCIVGEGEARAELESLRVELGLGDRVRLVGAMPAAHYLGEVDLFLTTSRYEGLPLALVEALAAGCPALASPIPAHREVMGPIVGGLLDDDPARWPARIAALLDDAPLRRRLAAEGRARARAAYSPEAQDEAYRRLYDRVATPR